MAKKFLTDLDLNKNELQNPVIQNLSSAPASPKEGQMFQNTADHQMYRFDGTNWIAIGDISAAVVTVTENAGSGETLKSYTIAQGGTTVGTINIPKDFLVKSAEIKTVTTANVPYQGAQVGDKYIDFVINTKTDVTSVVTDDHIYLPINDLAHVYREGNGINISNADEISIKIDSNNANGLATTSSGLKLTLATQSAAGAMSATDKRNLDGLTQEIIGVAHRFKVTNPSLTPSGGICTWTIPSTSFGNNDGTYATCTIRDSSGNEVVADIKYETNSITVKFNSSSTVSAATYTAVVIS